jgi:fatty-acid desaturase
MKRWMKVLLGLGTHWFLVYLPLFLGFVFTVIATAPKGGQVAPPPAFFLGLGLFVLGHFLSILAMLGTMGICLAYAVKHPRFTSNERLLWALLLAFAGAFAMPVFYWLYLHKHPIGEPFFGPKDPS